MKTAAAIICMLLFAAGGYCMIETLSTEKLAHSADVIVIADIMGVKSVGLKEKSLEVIANLIKVHEPLKGGVAVGEELKIKTWRGIEDNAILQEGTRALLFLKKADGYYTVYNGLQGWWPMNEDGSFSGMGDGISLEKVKEAIKAPPPASSTYVPVSF